MAYTPEQIARARQLKGYFEQMTEQMYFDLVVFPLEMEFELEPSEAEDLAQQA